MEELGLVGPPGPPGPPVCVGYHKKEAIKLLNSIFLNKREKQVKEDRPALKENAVKMELKGIL